MCFWRWVLFLSLIFHFGCNDDDPKPAQKVGGVAGVVTDIEGNALSGVFVEAMNMAVPTDNEGNFLLEEVPVGEEVLIKFSKSGYVTNYKSVPVVENQVSPINAALSVTSYDAMINSDQENDMSFAGAKVSLPANALVDENGNPVSGSINAKATYFDPTGDYYYDAFPGDFTGISSNGEEGLLESYGFIDVSFTQNGEELVLADGMSSEISIPIPQELLANAPDPIPLFFFDEEDGRWKEEGSASIVDGKYVGTVEHFSSWNADRLYDDEICTIKGRVIDQEGNPLWLARVNARGTDFVGSNYAFTDLDGTFSMQIKSDASINIKAYWTSLILGLCYGESGEIFISNTCPPDGMNDIGDIIVDVDCLGDTGSDDVWWDVFILPKATGEIANDETVDFWRVGKGGKIELCENCNLNSVNWQSQNSNTSQTILGIHFIDRDNGWICGNNGLVKKTTNRGQTWETVSLETFGNDMYEIEFTDENHGFMAGTAGQFWYTSNGGQTWNRANTNFNFDLWDMDFVSSESGWAVGPVGRIFKTEDGGRNWTQQVSGVTSDLYGVSFVNKYFGWVVGLNGTLLFTEDGGNSWSDLDPGTSEDLLAIEFYQPNFGVITASNGKLLTSFDRGNSWSITDVIAQANTDESPELWAVDLHDYYGIFGGEGITNFLGDANLETVPSGWYSVPSSTSSDLRAVSFIDNNVGYAVGHNGTLLKSTNGGLSWSELNSAITENLTDISLIDDAIFLCGGDESVHRSLDNGQTWKTLRNDASSFWEFTKIQFTSINKGFLLGNVGIEEFLYTTDTGNTWLTVPDLPPIGSDLIIYDFEFLSEREGFVSGYSISNDEGVLYQTTDGGLNWSLVYNLAPFGQVNNVRFKNLELLGENTLVMDQAFMLFKSENNGNAWSILSSYAPNEFQFVDEQRAWGTGFWKLLGGGTTILFSDDGGRNWKPQGSELGAIEGINGMYMFNEDIGIAVGTDGQIYRTEKGGF